MIENRNAKFQTIAWNIKLGIGLMIINLEFEASLLDSK